MTQTLHPSPPHIRTPSWRTGLNVLLGFIVLYVTIWIVRVIMGVVPNMLMRWLGATPNFRAFIGSTLNHGVGIVFYIVFPALALRKVLGIDPRPIFFPIRKGWWQDLLFGFLLVATILALFFVIEVKAGWLIVESWNWQNIELNAWIRVLWVGLLVNTGVAIGEETIFRGYLLTGLKTVWGKRIGLTLMMVIFGLFHLPAYFEGGMRSGTLTLAILLASSFGLMFGLIYLRTGSLWLPVILHFTWNFVETDLFNLSADSTNPNLIGALTRLQSPLTMTEIGFGNVVVIEMLAFAMIAFGVWLWLRNRPTDTITHLST
ncbi:MAG: CPBP family intramembrane metalloprotease [Anaerolineales bacterium]|nr:CPBP family intramembrane metalloprotease [Anaerolineales bacterium]